MAQIALTEEQKRKKRLEKRMRMIADGLASFKNRNNLSNENLADGLGIGRNSVANILKDDGDVRLSITNVLWLLEVSGIDLVPRERKA